jgi:CRP-like cAMP-binding protein
MAAGGLSVEELLERVELFGAFTGAERRQLAECMAERFFAAGTTIVDEGEPGDSLFVVAEGAVDVSGSSPDGARLALDRMVAGDVFGEMSLLTGAPRSASITAATDVAAYEVRREHLEPLLRDRPGAAAALAAIMMERQRRNAEMRDARAASEADTAGDASGLLRRLRAFFGLGGGSAV